MPQFPYLHSRQELVQFGLLASVALWVGTSSLRAAPVRYVDLLVETDGDLLEFKQKTLSCPTGAHVRLTFRHTGKYVSFEHNWVLILPGSFDAVTAGAVAGRSRRGVAHAHH